MNFPEFLYNLTARDQQLAPIELWYGGTTGTALATGIQTPNYQVPPDRILVITSAYLLLAPGAGQSGLSASLSVQNITNGASTRIDAHTFAAPAAAQWAENGEFSSVIVPPNGLVFAVGFFNAGAVANSVRWEASGVLIPRGNIII